MARSTVSQALPMLPDVVKATGVTVKKKSPSVLLVVNLYSEVDPQTKQPLHDQLYLSNYATIQVKDELARLEGVGDVVLFGQQDYSMRIWLDPDKMAVRDVTADDVVRVLKEQNVQVAAGQIGQPPVPSGQDFQYVLTTLGRLSEPDEFAEIILKTGSDGRITRLHDVGRMELGARNEDTLCRLDGQPSAGLAIYQSPGANALAVADEVRAKMEQLRKRFPQGLQYAIVYDTTPFIEESVHEVFSTLRDAVILVAIVILLFLQDWKSLVLPMIDVGVSLVGTFAVMYLMGFTLNNLTLFGLVLAIGIVVDDAIVVLENIHRHIEEGLTPTEAALKGARELAWPVVAMTTTLVAVYLPIGFQGGLTGILFTEFAFTLAGSVLLSGVIALTLSPMMSAKILKPHGAGGKGRLEAWLDRKFDALQTGYMRRLHGTLETKSVVAAFGAIVLVSCVFLYATAPKEPAPLEDEGFIFAISQADPTATLDYVERYTEEMSRIAQGIPEVQDYFLFNGGFGGSGGGASPMAMAGFVLKPWSERSRSTKQVLEQDLQPQIAEVTGLNTFALVPPSLPSAGGDGGGEFIIGGVGDLAQLDELADAILQRAMESRRFIFLDKDLKIDKPRIEVHIDRDKAASLGIDMRTLAADMSAMLSGGYTNRFAMQNRSYLVIPQVQRSDRLNASDLQNYYTRTRDGELIPLSTLVTLKDSAQPQSLKRFQQLNAVAITFAPRPGVSKGEALAILDQAARDILPQGYTVDYAGESRQFKQEGSAMLLTLALALVVIFLVLSAQFESFRDATIMLLTVPMAICGALLTINVLAIVGGILGFAGIEAFPGMSINIYTQVGLVTLVGVISKHGILIVEFANKLQINEGLSKREAIERAAAIRLRPVLMTTAALVFAMVPLLIARGPGAASRFSMGTVIASGMTIGTLFTLFVLPAFYMYLARDHARDAGAAAAAAEPQHA